jgi:hypothetical protein
MANSASDMDIDDDTVFYVGDIVVAQDTNNEQEPEVITPEEIEKNDQSFASGSSNDFDVLAMSPCSGYAEKKEKIISPQKLKSGQKKRLKKRRETIRDLNLEIRHLEAVS